MPNTQTLLAQAHSAFNHRDIDSALALMSENVSWPKASEGGRVVGKEQIRSYWTRQWKEFDPHVEPLEVIDHEGGNTEVKVHQLVKSLGGDVLSDSEVVARLYHRERSHRAHGPQGRRNELGPNPICSILQTLACVRICRCYLSGNAMPTGVPIFPARCGRISIGMSHSLQ
jgi:hypothetical protein